MDPVEQHIFGTGAAPWSPAGMPKFTVKCHFEGNGSNNFTSDITYDNMGEAMDALQFIQGNYPSIAAHFWIGYAS